MPNPTLDIANLMAMATKFSKIESSHKEPLLYGVDNGKTIGTYIEQKFQRYLFERFLFQVGNSANGIDFPTLGVDIKVTSAKQPQSSCPFKSARQKIYGLGYALLVFVYDKTDEPVARTSTLAIAHTVFVEAAYTADYQTTKGIADILDRDGNEDDLIGFMGDRNLPLDDIQAQQLAIEILTVRPIQGYLTISNALQWRLQYNRVIEQAGRVPGISRL